MKTDIFLDLDNNKISTEYGDMPAHLKMPRKLKSQSGTAMGEEDSYISIKWRVMQPAEYANRVIFQKVKSAWHKQR